MSLEDCLSLYQLRQHDVSEFLQQSPEMVRLHEVWSGVAIDEYKTTLSMSCDRALHLKDTCMMADGLCSLA